MRSESVYLYCEDVVVAMVSYRTLATMNLFIDKQYSSLYDRNLFIQQHPSWSFSRNDASDDTRRFLADVQMNFAPEILQKRSSHGKCARQTHQKLCSSVPGCTKPEPCQNRDHE